MRQWRIGSLAVTSARAKRFEYTASIDTTGGISAYGGSRVDLGDEWSAEALVLAGLVRCSITSFQYHAGQLGLDAVASGTASGVVTKRDSDGRYAFVEIECRIDAELDRGLNRDEVRELVTKSVRDCFIGASLTAAATYRWRVNGADVEVM